MGGGFGAVTRTVAAGFAAYTRILHPAGDAAGRPVTWSDVGVVTGRTVHPSVQWHALVDSTDPINTDISCRWEHYPPDRGALAAEQLAALVGVLAGHTADPRDCYACLWEGWASAAAPDGVLTATEVDAPLVEHPGRRYRLYAGPLPRPQQFSLLNLAFLSRATGFCPEAVVKPAWWRSRKVPGDGHGICPVLTITGLGAQLKGLTPWPARAWACRTLSPLVWQRWAWCRSRSTVAVARVLGMSSSNAAGCRLEEIATERFS